MGTLSSSAHKAWKRWAPWLEVVSMRFLLFVPLRTADCPQYARAWFTLPQKISHYLWTRHWLTCRCQFFSSSADSWFCFRDLINKAISHVKCFRTCFPRKWWNACDMIGDKHFQVNALKVGLIPFPEFDSRVTNWPVYTDSYSSDSLVFQRIHFILCCNKRCKSIFSDELYDAIRKVLNKWRFLKYLLKFDISRHCHHCYHSHTVTDAKASSRASVGVSLPA